MKDGSFTVEADEDGGSSGRAKRWVINLAQSREICSCPEYGSGYHETDATD